MDLRERLEVIAADYYTKAMAIRTTIHILYDLEQLENKKVKKVNKRKYKMSSAAKKAISKRMKAYWKARRANKSNK